MARFLRALASDGFTAWAATIASIRNGLAPKGRPQRANPNKSEQAEETKKPSKLGILETKN